MIDGKSVLAVIPARRGSKGLPGKNVVNVGGRPLIAWTINAAAASHYIDRTVISSDDTEIIAAAEAAGGDVPFVRPAHLATDEAPVEVVTLHVLDNLDQKYDLLVLLQPTSPLRVGQDIDACLELCMKSGASSAVTVAEAAKSPYWMFNLEPNGRMDRILPYPEGDHRRQSLPPAYTLNGAVYVVDVQYFRETQKFIDAGTVASVMPSERSIDVDTSMDLTILKALLAQNLDTETSADEGMR